VPSGPSRCELGQIGQAETHPCRASGALKPEIRAARASKLCHAMVKYLNLQPRSTR
jgi:hypothetical protein